MTLVHGLIARLAERTQHHGFNHVAVRPLMHRTQQLLIIARLRLVAAAQ